MTIDQHPTIAIVGAGGIFPRAGNLSAFWHNIVSCENAIRPVPPERWPVDVDQVYAATAAPDKARSLNAGLITSFTFNPEGLALGPETVAHLDPMHHLVLEAGRSAWHDSRHAPVDPQRVDVILAAIALPTNAASRLTRQVLRTAAELKLFKGDGGQSPPVLSPHEAIASCVTSLPAALLSAALDLGGGTLTLDAACASSLFAIKLGCDRLQAGRADAVLAGGVARPDALYTQIGFTQLQALSPSGRCAPFDRSADGLVVGEGCGMLVLKRLDDALAHGDTIYALIRGAGVSNDMRGNLLAPDSEGQLRAMRMAYAAAGWRPTEVDLIECHGAGTPVGDATELRSLNRLWGRAGWQTGQCAIGSIKSMIGHLLTAAGSAGLIKVLLGLRHGVLPPSLNFNHAAPDSPLQESPFHIPTRPSPWELRDGDTPRRAAVSAFGFGGINAHLLVEEWRPSAKAAAATVTPVATTPEGRSAVTGEPIALVGMEALFAPVPGLRAFQETVFRGRSAFQPPENGRWKQCGHLLQHFLKRDQPLPGAYLNDFQIDLSEFRIPPKEIPDILPQHLLMLKAALGAMADTGLDTHQENTRMGCIIGMEFDLEDTNFHLRWDTQKVAWQWNARFSLDLSRDQIAAWARSLADAHAPPLTHTRTLGSLGSLIASRIARELRFGGPSFIVSSEAASGLQALALAGQMLQRREVDHMLVGAVDLPGDLRRLIRDERLQLLSSGDTPHCLDRRADGTLPGEGAAAVVIKRWEDARRDGDRIYAVVRGLADARRGEPYGRDGLAAACTRALGDSLAAAQTPPDSIGYIETHGSGRPQEDGAEFEAIRQVFAGRTAPLALGALKACLGHSGAAAGLAGLVKAALCLYQQILPPLPHFQQAPEGAMDTESIHIPIQPIFWPLNQAHQPRRACLNALTPEGNAVAVVLEEAPDDPKARHDVLRLAPTGVPDQGLFLIEGRDHAELERTLASLATHLRQSRSAGQSIGIAARQWLRTHPPEAILPCAMAFSFSHHRDFDPLREAARSALANGRALSFAGLEGGHFSPQPLGPSAPPVLVYPGSGNHYVGMGRQFSVQWPEIWRRANRRSDRFADQCRFARLMPYRSQWPPDWSRQARAAIDADPVGIICGQVVFGCLTTDLLADFGLRPSAVIGYSLGETVAYFATGAWSDRDRMLDRMEKSDLFRTQLAGPCLAAGQVLPLPANAALDWRVAVVNRSAAQVRDHLPDFPAARLLIINTPDECVIGGHGPEVEALVRRMACEAIFLQGLLSVHCEAVQPVAEAYRRLHLFPTVPAEGLDYYSCAEGRRIDLTSDAAADSLMKQAVEGFDFNATIEQAYSDGQRFFLEVGPQGSCTRMIRRILTGRPHLALTVAPGPADEVSGLSRALAVMAAERLPVRLDRFYPPEDALAVSTRRTPARPMRIDCGGMPLRPPGPPLPVAAPAAPPPEATPGPESMAPPASDSTGGGPQDAFFDQTRALMDEMNTSLASTSAAHQKFLALTDEISRQYARTIDIQRQLIHQARGEDWHPATPGAENGAPALNKALPWPPSEAPAHSPERSPAVAFDRDLCMEFAVGSVARVLGPAFAAVDSYPARVRLPDTPLMLVDRILRVDAQKGVLGPGRLVTEHDVRPGAWYLDGDRAPVCIAVEAGQADLFLAAYMGIDLVVKGERTYRLLDAAVTFHRGLPRPGEVIRYDIAIDKFIRQGPTWMFFFRFEGTIEGAPLITMRNGCAGFFTEEEVRHSGGVILTADDLAPRPGTAPRDWQTPVPMIAERYDAAGLEALREGDLAACFGQTFAGIQLPKAQRLPGGRMALIDRVQTLDPAGGRYGLGLIRAEADIHPDDWFLTCHFVDDMVMPGTLMYECCAHTLRIYLQRMGWISHRPDVVYEPVIGRQAVLKCRGPVTPQTRQVVYEVEISAIGFNPEPFVIADAHMYADGQRIVMFRGMTMKMTGLDRAALEDFWRTREAPKTRPATASLAPSPEDYIFTRDHVIEFANGAPSQAFGPPYRPFDDARFIARLPGPPYAFIDGVTSIEPAPWVLAPDGWLQTVCHVHPQDWYFRSNGTPTMPLCILMEIALQACGFLAAYMGSALQSDQDLHFRNLDGAATLHANATGQAGPVQARARLLKFSAAGDMLIEHYAFEVHQAGCKIYEGETSFGFFTPAALAHQVGLAEDDRPKTMDGEARPATRPPVTLEDVAPLTPDDPRVLPWGKSALPSRALRMIDRIEQFVPDGGPHGLGFVRGSKRIDPQEWFFKAHFYQDPVCPGSLGIESCIQLLRYAAGAFWPAYTKTHTMALLAPAPHSWRYRGQILPTSREVEVDAMITERRDGPQPLLKADGYLKCDGLCIYKMQNFGLHLIPRETP